MPLCEQQAMVSGYIHLLAFLCHKPLIFKVDGYRQAYLISSEAIHQKNFVVMGDTLID